MSKSTEMAEICNDDIVLRGCKIAYIHDGYLKVDESNIEKIINKTNIDPGMMTAAISVIGPPTSGRSFWTNLLINYYAFEGCPDWVQRMTSSIDQGNAYGFGSSSNCFAPSQEDLATSAIYIWPKSFLKNSNDGKCKLLVWVLYLCHGLDGNNTHLQALERFLILTCSRLVELDMTNKNYRIIKEAVDLSGTKRFMANFCRSVVYLCCHLRKASQEECTSTKDDRAKTNICQFIENLEDFKLFKPSHLSVFKIFRMLEFEKIDEPLENWNLNLSPRVINLLDFIVRKMTGDNEIVTKPFRGHVVCVENFCSFMAHCAEDVNSLNQTFIRQPTMALYCSSPPSQPDSTLPPLSTALEIPLIENLPEPTLDPSHEPKNGQQQPCEEMTRIIPCLSESDELHSTNKRLRLDDEIVSLTRPQQPTSSTSSSLIVTEFLELIKLRFCDIAKEFIVGGEISLKYNKLKNIITKIIVPAQRLVRQSLTKKYGFQQQYDHFTPAIHQEFQKLCVGLFKDVNHFAQKFHDAMIKHFVYNLCFTNSQQLENIGKEEYMKITHDLQQQKVWLNPIESLLVAEIVFVKIMRYIKEHNDKMIENQQRISTILKAEAVECYKEEMIRLTTKIYDDDALIYDGKEIHCHLVQDILASLETVADKSSPQVFKLCDDLKNELMDDLKVSFENEYAEYAKDMAIMTAVAEASSNYVNCMAKKVEENQQLLSDCQILMWHHATLLKHTCSTLKTAIIQISNEEPLDGHLNSLRTFASNHWDTAIYPNVVKRRSSQDIEPTTNETKENGADDDKNNNNKGISTTATISPLVFHIQGEYITMGILNDGKPKLLLNKFLEDSTPLVVGLNNDGDLIYGSEVAATDITIIRKKWWIAQHLALKGYKSCWKEEIKWKDGAIHQISVEFLLGFLMKQLKNHVESTIRGNCLTAVVAIPMWMGSTQRIRVKDAVKIAGFTNVFLVNEGSAAAYYIACSSSSQNKENLPQNNDSINMLIVTQNHEMVDASVYNISSLISRNLTMVGHSGNYDLDLVQNEPQLKIKSGKKHILGGILDEAVKQLRKDNMVDFSNINSMITLHDSEAWGRFFKRFRASVRNTTTTFEEINAVIYGAILFTKNDPKEINNKVIQDKMALDLFCHLDGAKSVKKVFGKETVLPINDMKIQKMFTLSKHRGVRVYQYLKERRMYVGKLAVSKDIPVTHRICFHLCLNNEGIVELKQVCFSNMLSHKWEPLHPDLYLWETPNLTKKEKEKLQSLMESLNVASEEEEGFYEIHNIIQ